jgi:hypothetical protein
MKRILIGAVLLLLLSATPALAGPTLKQQLAAEKAKVAKLQRQLEKVRWAARARRQADAASIASFKDGFGGALTSIGQLQTDNFALQTQVREQSRGGLYAVLAGGQDNIWSALGTIWDAFPKLPAGQTCGYDKSSSLTVNSSTSFVATYAFTLTGC